MKEYEELDDIFQDLFQPSDILIFWGKRGKGKSSLEGKFMSEFMRPRNARKDVKNCKLLCEKLKDAGFNLHPPTDHLVFCDTQFGIRKIFGLQNRVAYSFDPISFGLPNAQHRTSLLLPFGKYSFDEAQDLFDSHISALSTFVTKSMELSRHINLFIMIAVQRPIRIHKDIREIATFVEVIDIENDVNKFGYVVKTTWTCNIIYDNAVLEEYLKTKDKKLIDKSVKFVFRGNIFGCYDSYYFMPMFFRGFENMDFELEKSKRTEFNPNSFADYYANRVIDIPDSYRGKRK